MALEPYLTDVTLEPAMSLAPDREYGTDSSGGW